jgi:hypothetical protein
MAARLWRLEADSLAGMTDRKAKAETGLAFVVSHPSHKNKDVARVGHPDLWFGYGVPEAKAPYLWLAFSGA